MTVKRKLLKILLMYFAVLAVLSLAIIGYLAYLHGHNVFYKFLSYWLTIIGSSFFIIESSRNIIKITRNPNIMRQCKTTSTTKRLVTLLYALSLFLMIITGIMVLSFLGNLICYGNITKPIYDLMFVSALIMYVMATTYGIWWGKKRYV